MATRVPYMWTHSDEVIHELGDGTYTPTDLGWIERCVIVADAYVKQVRPDVPVGMSDPIALGTTKLAASMYRRRGASGADFAEFADMSTPVLPGIIDAEIQALLGIGRHHAPVVA